MPTRIAGLPHRALGRVKKRLGERHLATVLAEYTRHYNGDRPHRSLGQQSPNPAPHVVDLNAARIHRRPILSGLINEYSRAA
jgi:putative transposase